MKREIKMKIKKIKFLVIMALAHSVLRVGPVFSEEQDIKTTEVVVKAKKAEPTGYYVNKSSSATKTDTPLKEIPQSVHIIPKSLIEDQQSISVSEVLNNVSSVVPNLGISTPAYESTKIRGFASEQLLDGFTQYYNAGDRDSLINVKQLEVLKGSNAVLFSGGSGSPVGGVINIISKLPEAKAFGEIGYKTGSYNFNRTFFDLNQPLNNNILFRITSEYTDAKSHLDVIDKKSYNINPSITFTDNDKTSLSFQGKVSRWSQQEYQGLPATGTVSGNFRLKSDMFIGPQNIPDSKSNFDGIWATLDHKLNDVWSINAKARYAESKFDEYAQIISGNSPDRTDLSPSTWSLYNTQLSQKQTEKSFLFNTTAKFDWGVTKNTLLLGADYSKYKDKGFMDLESSLDSDALKIMGYAIALNDLTITNCGNLYTNSLNTASCTASTTSLLSPSYGPYTKPGPALDNIFVTNTTYGYFAQIQSNVFDRLHLLASLRQAHIGIDYTGPELDLTATYVNVFSNNFSSVYNSSSSNTSKDKLLPRIGAVFDLTKEASVFANYSEGMRGQPFALFTGTPEPEETHQKEAGIKYSTDSLSGQFAVYHIERSHVAVPVSLTRSSTDGEQESKGFDTDITWKPSSEVRLLANYGYTDAEYTNSVRLSNITPGRKLVGIPKNSARVWINYDFPQDALRGLSAGVGAIRGLCGYRECV
jgi:iron complex outermembrane receptor protein